MTIFSNVPFDRLEIGMQAELRRTCEADDFYVFAHSSGNMNPLHLPKEDGDQDGTPEAIAPSAWIASLVSAALGNELPGPGTLYKSHDMTFHARAMVGDALVARIKLIAKHPPNIATFDTRVEKEDGTLVMQGTADVIAPMEPHSFDIRDVPGLLVENHKHFERLLERAEPLDPIPTAVIAPEDPSALAGALLAADHTIITPILIGDPDRIRATARDIGRDISAFTLLEAASHRDAAAMGVALVRAGQARAIMKGHLHTDDLLRPILSSDTGLKTGRRLSHIFVMDVPGLDHLLMVTDAAINIAPDLRTKVDIVQNAIELAISLGIDVPKVGILSAVETVNPSIPSTLDAAALSKMADRGQITGGHVDGPLAMDNAVSIAAARTKGIKGMVAGMAEILVAPNLEAGNMLAKELTFLAHAEAAGVVIGAACPIILNSRSDSDKSRLASCAVAALHAHRIKGASA